MTLKAFSQTVVLQPALTSAIVDVASGRSQIQVGLRDGSGNVQSRQLHTAGGRIFDRMSGEDMGDATDINAASAALLAAIEARLGSAVDDGKLGIKSVQAESKDVVDISDKVGPSPDLLIDSE